MLTRRQKALISVGAVVALGAVQLTARDKPTPRKYGFIEAGGGFVPPTQTGAGGGLAVTSPHAASTDGNNLCAGGGCQSFAYDGSHSYTGSTNTAFGIGAMGSNTTGYANEAFGPFVLAANTVGIDNTGMGQFALQSCTTCSYQTAIGQEAMNGMVDDVDSVAVGVLAMLNISHGDGNTAVGVQALGGGSASTTVVHSVAVGLNAANAVQTGATQIVAVGYEALQLSTTAAAVTAVGAFAGQNVTGAATGATLIGASAGSNMGNAQYNTFIGGLAGGGITTGTQNTVVGARVGGLAATTTDKIILADGTGTAADQLWISPTAPTSVSHGSLSTGSSNTWGSITTIGANTSTVLTFSQSGFPNRSWCVATPIASGTPEFIVVTNSASAPTFSCFNTTTGAAASCVDFNYWCTGQ